MPMLFRDVKDSFFKVTIRSKGLFEFSFDILAHYVKITGSFNKH